MVLTTLYPVLLPGLPSERSIHCDSRAPPTHCQWLLEDGVGVWSEVHRHALQEWRKECGLLGQFLCYTFILFSGGVSSVLAEGAWQHWDVWEVFCHPHQTECLQWLCHQENGDRREPGQRICQHCWLHLMLRTGHQFSEQSLEDELLCRLQGRVKSAQRTCWLSALMLVAVVGSRELTSTKLMAAYSFHIMHKDSIMIRRHVYPIVPKKIDLGMHSCNYLS